MTYGLVWEQFGTGRGAYWYSGTPPAEQRTTNLWTEVQE